MLGATITIPVAKEIAEAYETATPQEQLTIQILVSLRLRDFLTAAKDPRTMSEIMDDISDYAESQGLTPAILAEILGVPYEGDTDA